MTVSLGIRPPDFRGPRILAVTRGRGWQWGQKWLLRPPITMRRMAWPQRRQGSPVCWYTRNFLRNAPGRPSMSR